MGTTKPTTRCHACGTHGSITARTTHLTVTGKADTTGNVDHALSRPRTHWGRRAGAGIVSAIAALASINAAHAVGAVHACAPVVSATGTARRGNRFLRLAHQRAIEIAVLYRWICAIADGLTVRPSASILILVACCPTSCHVVRRSITTDRRATSCTSCTSCASELRVLTGLNIGASAIAHSRAAHPARLTATAAGGIAAHEFDAVTLRAFGATNTGHAKIFLASPSA